MKIRNLTERTTIKLTPEQRQAVRELEEEYGSTGEVIRQALTLFLAVKLSPSKQHASNGQAVSR